MMNDSTENAIGGVTEIARMGNLLKECQDLLAEQRIYIERLTIENKLLRSTSENSKLQMKLN